MVKYLLEAKSPQVESYPGVVSSRGIGVALESEALESCSERWRCFPHSNSVRGRIFQVEERT